MQEMQVRSLGWEDPLEEEMATYSSVLCLENSTDRRAWWATVHGVAKSQTRLSTHTHTHTHMPVSILSFQHGPLCSFICRAGLLMRNLLFCIFLNWQCLHFSLFLNFSLDMEFLVDNPFSTSTLLFYCLLASIVSDEKSAINFIVYPLCLWVIFLLLFSGFSLCLLTVCLWCIQV